MKKRVAVMAAVICLAALALPTISRAAVTPYFVAVNDTLLPFNDDTMPLISGGEIFVPPETFAGVSVWSVASEELEQVRLYRGVSKHVDFYTARGVTIDQDDKLLSWPPAKRVGSRFYVPLKEVCDFFDLQLETLDVPRDIIPQQQMKVIRIKSDAWLEEKAFFGIYRNTLRKSYNDYYSAPPANTPSPPPATMPGGETSAPPPSPPPPPIYSDVTIYLSYYDISAGGVSRLLELLDSSAASGCHCCFFVSADDIRSDPEMIRRISGSGQTVGIWLEEGTLQEYEDTSALLFEAAKLKTVLVSTDEVSPDLKAEAEARGLIIWESSRSLVYNDSLTVANVTAMLPTDSGARQNLMSSCSPGAAAMLSGILSYLREYEYRIDAITETVAPLS